MLLHAPKAPACAGNVCREKVKSGFDLIGIPHLSVCLVSVQAAAGRQWHAHAHSHSESASGAACLLSIRPGIRLAPTVKQSTVQHLVLGIYDLFSPHPLPWYVVTSSRY